MGNYVYAASASNGLVIYDVSNKNLPSRAGVYDTPDRALDIDVQGDYAFIADQNDGLIIINISDPTNPILAGSFDTPGSANGVFVQGNYAYVADGLSGLNIINITDKINPVSVGNYNTSGEAIDVVIKDNFALVADYAGGLQIINISNPVTPTLVGSYNATTKRARGVAFSGDFAYIADEINGVRIINISNPASPIQSGYFLTPSQGYGIIAHQDTLFEADYDGGLMIIRNDLPLPVELESFSAKENKSSVSLDWRTATELNNYGFEIEKKKQDKSNWLSIGFVAGNGNSNSTKQYNFVDRDISGSSKLFYRLKQIDNNGAYKYSNEVEVKINPDNFSLAQNFPNPFNPSTKIKYTVPSVGTELMTFVQLKVYDILGNEVAVIVNKEQRAGFYEVEFNAGNPANGNSLSSGVYIYQLRAGKFISTRKMILTK